MLKGIHLTLMMGPVVAVPVGRDVAEALTAVTVTTAAGSRSGFQLTFAVGKASTIARTLLPAGFFDPPARVIVVVTVAGSAEVVMDGVVTRHELAAGNEPGQGTLTVTGEDVSRMMDLFDFSGIPYPAMPVEARVALMIAKYAAYGIIPLVIPSVLVDVPLPTQYIPAHQGTDLAYINALAASVGYVFYVEPGPVPGVNTAYWGPEVKVGAPQPALTANMDAHTNVESLSFAFDPMGKKLYLLFVQLPVVNVNIAVPVPDITPLNPPLGLKPAPPFGVEQIKDGTAKHTIPQAVMQALAKASRSADVVAATGSLDVLRYGRVLKARRLVAVRGAGLAHDGLYFVKSVTHTIKRGEYKQNFSLTRNATVPFSDKVPV